MAHHRVVDLARHHRAACRDNRRVSPLGEAMLTEMVDTAATPSRLVLGKDLLGEIRNRMTDEERAVLDRRTQGLSWEEIAAQLDCTSGAVRKRLTRALDRIGTALGLHELCHD
jgi:DNA-directed RNA polymerase specialized sigma24 family protein